MKFDSRAKPLVSIVSPCFNSGLYLEGCIQSVLHQDYPRVEHIIQDGNSKDTTVKILQKYRHPKYKKRIRIYSEPDSSQNEGLDKVLKKISGELFLVLNADDELLPNACTWGVEKLTQNPGCAAIYGDEYIIDERGKIIGIHIGKEPYVYERVFCVELVPPAQATFIRTKMFKDVGLHADTTISTCPDFEMWVRLGARYPLQHEYGIVSKYRQHRLSGSRRPEMTKKLVQAKLDVINRVLNDSRTPKAIKKLRFRAYGGLYHWGANISSSIKLYRLALRYMILSIFYRPKITKVIEITKFFLHHVPNYTKTKLFSNL